MYLSELFLKNVNGNLTKEAVKKALRICNQEMIRRMGDFDDEKGMETILFEDGEEGDVTGAFQEIMDFWEVYCEFDGALSLEEKDEFPILRIVYEADGMYQSIRNQNLLEKMDAWELKRLQELCKKIEEIYNTKTIAFFVKEKSGINLRYEMTLDNFEEGLLSFNYVAVQNRLIDIMRTGGIAVVVAGSKGMTPQRLHGFALYNHDWFTCPQDVLEMFRDIILSEHKLESRRGNLKGIDC